MGVGRSMLSGATAVLPQNGRVVPISVKIEQFNARKLRNFIELISARTGRTNAHSIRDDLQLLARLAQRRRISSLYGLSLGHVGAMFGTAVHLAIGAVIDARRLVDPDPEPRL